MHSVSHTKKKNSSLQEPLCFLRLRERESPLSMPNWKGWEDDLEKVWEGRQSLHRECFISRKALSMQNEKKSSKRRLRMTESTALLWRKERDAKAGGCPLWKAKACSCTKGSALQTEGTQSAEAPDENTQILKCWEKETINKAPDGNKLKLLRKILFQALARQGETPPFIIPIPALRILTCDPRPTERRWKGLRKKISAGPEWAIGPEVFLTEAKLSVKKVIELAQAPERHANTACY